MFGLDYVVFRPHNVYGERQNIADRYRNRRKRFGLRFNLIAAIYNLELKAAY